MFFPVQFLYAAVFLLYAAVARGELVDEEMGISITEDQAYYAATTYGKAIARVTKNAVTDECKEKVENEFRRYLEPLSFEESFPFERTMFWTECSSVKKPTLASLHFKSEGPPKPPPIVRPPQRSNVTLDPDTLSILYVVLVHDHPEFAIRMLQALDEPMHTFVIHVDKKSDSTFNALFEYSQSRTNVHVLDNRVSGTWGGFSLVNATLLCIQYALDQDIPFDFFVDISGQSYPIKSNEVIRATLAVDSNRVYLDSKPEPNIPAPELWHHYVECDDRSHRITRLPLPRGIHLFMGSQWLILPNHVVRWLLTDPLAKNFTAYAQHIMVADEHYFPTLLRNSPYCADIVNQNLNYLVFGEWESKLRASEAERDWRKCNQPDPLHCGRSPTTLTDQFKRSVKYSRALYARKFDPANASSMEFVDVIDQIRKDPPVSFNEREMENAMYMVRQKIQGQPSATADALCLQLELRSSRPLIAAPCNAWNEAQWFDVGSCMGNSSVTKNEVRADSSKCGDKVADESDHFCFIKTAMRKLTSASNSNRETSFPFCLDIAGENPNPGGSLIGYDCTGGWNQHWRVLPDCTISAVQPRAVALTRGLQSAEEMTVCLKIQETKSEKESESEWRLVKTAECHAESSDEMTFDFLSRFRGTTWKDLKNKRRDAPVQEATPSIQKKEKKATLSEWSRSLAGQGGIKKEF